MAEKGQTTVTPDEFVKFLGSEKAYAILRTNIAEAAAPAMEAAVAMSRPYR